SELAGEGFFVLPFTVGGEAAGSLILHSLVEPAQAFARGRALALLGDIVGQALTLARVRDALERLCHDLESELGVTRQPLSPPHRSHRAVRPARGVARPPARAPQLPLRPARLARAARSGRRARPCARGALRPPPRLGSQHSPLYLPRHCPPRCRPACGPSSQG